MDMMDAKLFLNLAPPTIEFVYICFGAGDSFIRGWS
jgi:hypothetical protein